MRPKRIQLAHIGVNILHIYLWTHFCCFCQIRHRENIGVLSLLKYHMSAHMYEDGNKNNGDDNNYYISSELVLFKLA